MGDTVLEDFRGKDCAFVANWLRGKGLNKLCVFTMKVKYNTYPGDSIQQHKIK